MKIGTGLKAALIGAIGISSIAPVPHNVNQSITVEQRTNKEKEAILKYTPTAKEYVRSYAGGLNVISSGVGIPPHIYGTFYVKRGTHKRTNK